MNTCNVCFRGEIKEVLFGYPSYLELWKSILKTEERLVELTLVLLNKLRCHTHF